VRSGSDVLVFHFSGFPPLKEKMVYHCAHKTEYGYRAALSAAAPLCNEIFGMDNSMDVSNMRGFLSVYSLYFCKQYFSQYYII